MPFFIRNKRKAIQEPKGKHAINAAKLAKTKKKSFKGNEEIDSGSDDDNVIEVKPHKRAKEESSDEELIETGQEKRLRLAKQYLDDIKEQEAARSADSGVDDEDGDGEDVITRRLQQDVLEQKGQINKEIASQYSCPTPDDVHILRGHQLSLTCVVISADDKYIYSCSKDCSINKYCVETHKKIATIHGGRKGTDSKHIGHTSHVLALAVTTDNKYLASGDRNLKIMIWNADTLELHHTFRGHTRPITGLAFRRCTHQLFSCSEDKTVKIWNVAEKTYIETLFGHQDGITGIDCLSRDRAVTCGGRDLSVRIWKVVEESQLVFNGHSGSIDCVALINDQHFITGADDNSIALWGVMKKKPMVTLKQAHCGDTSTTAHGQLHNNWITAVASLQYTDLVCTGSNDGFIRFWQCNNEFRHLKPLFRFAIKGFVNSLKFSSNGEFLVAGIGQEHKLGRWWSDKSSKNSVVIIKLSINKE